MLQGLGFKEEILKIVSAEDVPAEGTPQCREYDYIKELRELMGASYSANTFDLWIQPIDATTWLKHSAGVE